MHVVQIQSGLGAHTEGSGLSMTAHEYSFQGSTTALEVPWHTRRQRQAGT